MALNRCIMKHAKELIFLLISLTAIFIGHYMILKKTTAVSIKHMKLQEDSLSKDTGLLVEKIIEDNGTLASLQRNDVTARVDEKGIETLPTSGIVEEKDVRKKRLPKCLIIGFSKCGTHALKAFLALHPDIVVAMFEISFFTGNYGKGLRWYRDQMPPSLESQITVEKTPSYILSSEALHRIKSFNASIKLILMVRDPVTRIQSMYARNQAVNKNFNTSFYTFALKHIDTCANFAFHISGLFKLFPRNQILVINEERLEEEPLSVMKELETFLGLRPAFTDDLLEFNKDKGFYCFNTAHPRYQEIADVVSSLNKKTGCFSGSKGRPHPEFSPKLLRMLTEIAAPFNEELFHLIGKRFPWTSMRDQ